MITVSPDNLKAVKRESVTIGRKLLDYNCLQTVFVSN
jgi:hypothetical protein